ncbi:MAG TPA: nuclear transport factor 2 family protein [Steroidobacter sp.]|nr:nuclear transport factor 2 family protein [Steroidobacter sp.]
MAVTEDMNLTTVRTYLHDLQNGATGDALAKFFTADAVQIELPNKLNPHGGRSDLTTILDRAAVGQRLLQRQSYEILSEVAHGQRVAIEAKWSAVLAVPLDSLPIGSTLTAHFAIFFELRDGLICSQRNYDCFEPWS